MSEDFEVNSCRICLTNTKKLRSLYKPIDEGDEPPNEMLEKITGIQVEQMNEYIMLPKNICKNCELSLSMAFEFRANALKTQQLIVDYLERLETMEIAKETITIASECQKEYENIEMDIMPVDSPVNLEDSFENDEDSNIQEQQHGEAETYSFVLQNDKQEFVEQSGKYILEDNVINETYNDDDDDNENYTNHQQLKEDFEIDEEERIYKEDEEQEFHDEVQEHEQEEENAENNEIKVESSQTTEVLETKVLKKKSNIRKSTTSSCKKVRKSFLNLKSQEHEELDNQEHEEIVIPRRGRKPLDPTQIFNHICDVCGNIYVKRSRMMEHRQRHDKELKYSCELCDQKFHMRELLRKHMYSHSGGKPFKCEFCSRTFYYESVKKAHEAVHQGHRPYVCDVCGKAFGYAHALKKHKLIHADIKLFRCGYCNKDFRLQHHMKQHELTRMHQNAVRLAETGENPTYDEDVDDVEEGEADHEFMEEDDDILLVEEIPEGQ